MSQDPHEDDESHFWDIFIQVAKKIFEEPRGNYQQRRQEIERGKSRICKILEKVEKNVADQKK